MDELVFRGTVSDGAGRFAKELEVPGAGRVSVPIRDWPATLHPGTLNVRIREFPGGFAAIFGGESVRLLDSRRFSPEAEIPHDEIGNNTLPPTADKPDQGNAQVWRATLRADATQRECVCWVLRRIGSGLSRALECVSGERLRTTIEVETGDPVTVVMSGTWRT